MSLGIYDPTKSGLIYEPPGNREKVGEANRSGGSVESGLAHKKTDSPYAPMDEEYGINVLDIPT